MAKRGRKELLTPTVDWKCRIPIDIASKVDLLLLDPIRGVPVYGARSELVAALLRAWLQAQLRQTDVGVAPSGNIGDNIVSTNPTSE